MKCMKMRAKKRSSACKFYIPFLLLFLFFFLPSSVEYPEGSPEEGYSGSSKFHLHEGNG